VQNTGQKGRFINLDIDFVAAEAKNEYHSKKL
jgi:hypothetical protein